MSHIVTVEAEVRDAEALRAACRRLGLARPILETTRLFSGQVTGYAVRLHDWRYPVVCDLKSGQVKFDNFQGRWGQQRELDRLMQMYAVEKVLLESRRKGHSVSEQTLADGNIKLTIHVRDAS